MVFFKFGFYFGFHIWCLKYHGQTSSNLSQSRKTMARKVAEHGHDSKIMPAASIKSFLGIDKSDKIDGAYSVR